MGYRDVYLHSASISRENIVLYIELEIKSDTPTTKTYHYERATSDEHILGIRKETRHRLLSLLVISDRQENIHISNSQRDFGRDLYISSRLALWRH